MFLCLSQDSSMHGICRAHLDTALWPLAFIRSGDPLSATSMCVPCLSPVWLQERGKGVNGVGFSWGLSPWLDFFLHPHLVIALCVYVLMPSSCKDTNHIGLELTLNNLTISWLPLWGPYFQKRSYSDIRGVRTATYLYWGGEDTIQLIIPTYERVMTSRSCKVLVRARFSFMS